jgi:hypothetical protein
MISEEKIKKERKRLRRGEPEGEIRNALRKEGYSEEDIDKIFVPYQSESMRSWYLVFGIVSLIAAIWFFSMWLVAASTILLSMYYAETQKLKKKISS